MSLLAAAVASLNPPPPTPDPWVPDVFQLGTMSQIVVDGNSISADHVFTGTLAQTISDRMGPARLGTKIESTSISGQTWADMLANHADVNALWDDSRSMHALVINETTNSIRLGGTVAQTKLDIAAYIEAVTTAHPWVVIAWPALPAGRGDPANYPQEPINNAGFIEVNNWMRDNAASLGIHHWIDNRSTSPQFNHDGNTAANFAAYQSGWIESPPANVLWNLFGWLHPTVGTWPVGATPGTGKRALAAPIADAFMNGSIRALP